MRYFSFSKTALCFLLAIQHFCMNTAFAQTDHATHFELAAGVGVGSTDELLDGYKFAPSRHYNIVDQYSGTFTGGVRYLFNDGSSLGIMTAYEKESGTWQAYQNSSNSINAQAIKLGTYSLQALTLVLELKGYYNKKNAATSLTRMYITLASGVTIKQETDRYSDSYYASLYPNGTNVTASQHATGKAYHYNGYFSPFGISVGHRLSWCAELGIGYKGIINTGVTLKL